MIRLVAPHHTDLVSAERDDRRDVVVVDGRGRRRERKRGPPHVVAADGVVHVDLVRVVGRNLRVGDPELPGRVLRERDRLRASAVYRDGKAWVEAVGLRRRVVAEPRELRRAGGDARWIGRLAPLGDHGRPRDDHGAVGRADAHAQRRHPAGPAAELAHRH